MWNISTYHWLQGIRYQFESYDDIFDLLTATAFPKIFNNVHPPIMKVKSLENVKIDCDHYKHCLVPDQNCNSLKQVDVAKEQSTSAHFAKLLIQELLTHRRLSANLKEEEIDSLEEANFQPMENKYSSSEDEDNKPQADAQNWTIEENDIYSLNTCLQVVDSSFEEILDDFSISSDDSSSEGEPVNTTNNILNSFEEESTVETKPLSQNIYQNVFDLRKDRLDQCRNKRQCFRISEDLYENIWEFSSQPSVDKLEIKHGNTNRVSTMFDETCQELVVPLVRPLKCDLDFIIPECVNQWMMRIRYEYCGEDEAPEVANSAKWNTFL